MKYITRDREAGNKIDTFETREAAERAIAEYEDQDRDNGEYTPDFYEVAINPAYYDAAVELMDDEIREAIHAEGNHITDEDFLSEYERRHAEKYGEEFAI